MDTIPSFTIDHTRLTPGIYVSRRDTVGGETVTTFDIRMTVTNREPALAPAAIHTIEHLAATYLRNRADWKDRVIYWGPMGCLTGNYFIVKGALEPEDIRQLMIDTFDFVAGYSGEVPGTTADACGNYMLHDLPMARYHATQYADRLRRYFRCEYPQL